MNLHLEPEKNTGEIFEKLWLPYSQMKTMLCPLKISHTQGVQMFLEDGNILIDGMASWWTACHGYNHPKIREALTKQLESMPHVMLGGLVHEPALQLADTLAKILPGDLNHSFFTDSGSVSVEVAMKMAVQFWMNQGIQGKTKFVSFLGAYHGDTMATMSVCDPEEGYHKLMQGYVPEQFILSIPKTEDDFVAFEIFLDKNLDKLAGVLIEPLVQGCGGMLFHETKQLSRIAKIVQSKKLLFIADEVFTGFMRTGSFFACEQANVEPDIICLSKALTGGTLPFAATVATTRVFQGFYSDNSDHCLMHGPTYMGNPLGCVAALASVDIFNEVDYEAKVHTIEHQLATELEVCKELEVVKEVRVKGAIGVIELKEKNLDWFKTAFINKGVWLRPFSNIVYTTPALTIEEDDLQKITSAMVEAVREWENECFNL